MKKIEIDFNIQTGKETITEREETNDEKKQRELDELKIKQYKASVEQRATARAALLNKLGITAEEAQLLLGGN